MGAGRVKAVAKSISFLFRSLGGYTHTHSVTAYIEVAGYEVTRYGIQFFEVRMLSYLKNLSSRIEKKCI